MTMLPHSVLLRTQEPRVPGAAFAALGSCFRRNTRFLTKENAA